MNAALRASRRQERRGAARYDGSVNSGSGNGWLRKNDVRTDTLSIEYKHTGAASLPADRRRTGHRGTQRRRGRP